MEFVQLLQETITNINHSINIDFRNWKKYLKIDNLLFEKILRIVAKKNEKQNCFISIWGHFIEVDFDEFSNDLGIIKKTYIQQNTKQSNSHFDYDKKLLLKILQKDASFLIDYINSLYTIKGNEHYLHEDHNLGIVWQVPDIEPILIRVFDLVIEKDVYLSIGEHFCNSFFNSLPENTRDRAKEFLLNYCRNNYENSKKMNVIVDIVRHKMNYLFEEIMLLYISKNQDIELFKKIYWIGNGGEVYGDVIFGDIDAAKWRNILSIVEKSNVGIKLLRIKEYIKNMIDSELKSADWERKRKFIEIW